MCRVFVCGAVVGVIAAIYAVGSPSSAEAAVFGRASGGVAWESDYAQAVEAARQQGKMLLILFYRPGIDRAGRRIERRTLSAAGVCEKLPNFVCARLPLGATICLDGTEVTVLQHASFAEMCGSAGVAIVDYAHCNTSYYGHVVSALPFSGRSYPSVQEISTLLDLPPGTLTQRTLIYAVRTHPEKPASTTGEFDPYLAEEAESHAQYQASIRLQGHHSWATRFHRISARLPAGLSAREVCAESWPGENLVDAAVECVRCWRLSSGHWSAVCAPSRLYGYDMKRGSNGVWYATGIFGGG